MLNADDSSSSSGDDHMQAGNNDNRELMTDNQILQLIPPSPNRKTASGKVQLKRCVYNDGVKHCPAYASCHGICSNHFLFCYRQRKLEVRNDRVIFTCDDTWVRTLQEQQLKRDSQPDSLASYQSATIAAGERGFFNNPTIHTAETPLRKRFCRDEIGSPENHTGATSDLNRMNIAIDPAHNINNHSNIDVAGSVVVQAWGGSATIAGECDRFKPTIHTAELPLNKRLCLEGVMSVDNHTGATSDLNKMSIQSCSGSDVMGISGDASQLRQISAESLALLMCDTSAPPAVSYGTNIINSLTQVDVDDDDDVTLVMSLNSMDCDDTTSVKQVYTTDGAPLMTSPGAGASTTVTVQGLNLPSARLDHCDTALMNNTRALNSVINDRIREEQLKDSEQQQQQQQQQHRDMGS